MDLHNIATQSHKCSILHTSSSQNPLLHPASSILSPEPNSVWISGEGLPQEIVLNLEQVQYNYQFVSAIVLVCAHDYETNPRVVEIWAAKDRHCAENGEFVYWDKLEMKKKRGKQMFSLDIPESQRIIKIVITETYGEYHTYLNQVMLLAEPDHQTSQSLYNQQQWQKISESPQRHQPKPTKHGIKNQKTSQAKSSRMKQQSPLDFFREIEERQKSLELKDIDDESFQNNAMLLTLSKNVIIMEENIQLLNRRVQVLEKHVQFTYENLQGNLMKRIEEVIDRKIQEKMEVKQRNRDREISEEPRRLKSCKDLATSRTIQQGGQQKNKKVMSLVAELNDKLKQRKKLATKLHKKMKTKSKPMSEYYD